MGDVVVGTCSWTDKTMVERWYPSGVTSPEARLRYYAARYDCVEVDSAFYAIPKVEYAVNWARRTPPNFTFHIKAYGMMTGHEVDERALHPELRDSAYRYEITPRMRVRDPEERMVERCFALFRESIQPLVDAEKMGGVLLQYPPWFTAKNRTEREHNLARIDYAAELLDPLPVFVEFRHASWAEGATLKRALSFLAERNLNFVSVDAPQVANGTSMPPVTAATGPFGYVRLHGRNRDMWNSFHTSAADRFDYLYSLEELAEWEAPVERLADETERTWVMFNNCKYDYAPRNAREMAAILGDLVADRAGDVPTGEPAEEEEQDVAQAASGPEQLGLGF